VFDESTLLRVVSESKADAVIQQARRAITRGKRGIYNIAENDGTISSLKAESELGWSSGFRNS